MTKKIKIPKTFSIKNGQPRHISSLVDEILKSKMPSPHPACADNYGPRRPPVKKPTITRMMSGDEWINFASLTVEQKQLCGPLWYEGEICILFADTNVGKSILAVQLADLICKGAGGTDNALPELKPESHPQSVVYADFELSIAQFGRRYSSEGTVGEDNDITKVYYPFGPRFNRVELYYDLTEDNAEEFATRQFADQIISDLEARVEESGSRVLIIDNITFMATGTESAADAMPLMKKLVALKKRRDLSILLLAHTPKRCLSNPLTRNDLQGSKMLINFADSAFAIGESTKGQDIRYIKQIKQRNCEQVYGRDNVLICRIGKVYENFLGFTSIGTGPEEEHLAQRVSKENTEQIREAVRLRESGLSPDRIAETMAISRATVFRLLRKGN